MFFLHIILSSVNIFYELPRNQLLLKYQATTYSELAVFSIQIVISLNIYRILKKEKKKMKPF